MLKDSGLTLSNESHQRQIEYTQITDYLLTMNKVKDWGRGGKQERYFWSKCSVNRLNICYIFFNITCIINNYPKQCSVSLYVNIYLSVLSVRIKVLVLEGWGWLQEWSLWGGAGAASCHTVGSSRHQQTHYRAQLSPSAKMVASPEKGV